MVMAELLNISKRLFEREPMVRCKLNTCFGTCCSYGVWVDLAEKEKIKENFSVIQSYMDSDAGSIEDWFETDIEDDSFTETGKVIHTKIVSRSQPFQRTTCIFVRKDHKCALQVASEQLGKHHWYLKPFYCVLHPLDIDENDQISLDETQQLLSEEKSCLRVSEDLNSPLLIFEEELRYLLGDHKFLNALDQAKQIWNLKTNQKIK